MHPEQKRIFKAMTPEQKVTVSLDLYYSAKRLKAAWLRKLHPDWSEDKINRKVREIFLYAQS